ncbi:MAG: threonylcarbamoyl-AMP synthase [Nitrospinae bacterium]|nr:threonylcarbamoyl-AMP synthase [Nitrospinota bacterium]
MQTIVVDPYAPRYPDLAEVAAAVRAGGVMVYPTDTIYGIGCDVYQPKALKKIETAKERDAGKPFSFVCRDVAQISEFAFVSNWTYRLMTRLLPGPYTFVLEARRTNLPKKMVGKRNTVGVRIPDNDVCRTLVELIGTPLVSTSLNRAGESPVADLADIPPELARHIDVAIDVGPLLGDPSTVIDATGPAPVVLRQGAGPVEF